MAYTLELYLCGRRERPLHQLNPSSQLNQKGFHTYHSFTNAFILDRVQRKAAAGAADVDQQAFIDPFLELEI